VYGDHSWTPPFTLLIARADLAVPAELVKRQKRPVVLLAGSSFRGAARGSPSGSDASQLTKHDAAGR